MSGDFDRNTFRDKIDISTIWLRHLDRTNQASAMSEEVYGAYVRQQLRLLPIEMQKWVIDQQDKYITRTPTLKYKKYCGQNQGTKYDPLLYDSTKPVKRLEDGSIDWSDPNILSPYLEVEEKIDYEEFNNLINVASERAGLSWKTEPMNTEYGLYPDKEDLDLGTPTPLDDPKKNEPQGQNPLYQICHIKYKGEIKRVTNFRGYACGIGENEKPWFFNEIAIRQKKIEPVVILVTATHGKGKTYCAIRIAEIFDKHFDPNKQIVMDRRNILKLVSGRSNLKRNQAIIIDESQWGASAREWGKPEQIKLMKFLAAARFKGYMILIVSLHRSMLDSIIRERIINFHIHMEERGKSTVYQPRHQRFDETNYPSRRGGLLLQLPDYDACDYMTCLDCTESASCNTIRAVYERNKTTFIEGEAEKDAYEDMLMAAAEMDENELVELLYPHWNNEIRTQVSVATTEKDIQDILDSEYGVIIDSMRKLKRLRSMLEDREELSNNSLVSTPI